MLITEAIAEFFADVQQRKATTDTLRTYHYALDKLAPWAPPQQLHVETLRATHVRQFFLDLKEEHDKRAGKPYSDTTLRSIQRIVKVFLHWCQENPEIEGMSRDLHRRVPMASVYQKDIEVLSDDDIKALLLAVSKQESPYLKARNRAILLLMLDTGIRISELALDTAKPSQREPTGLYKKDVHLDPQDSYIVVYGKGQKQREVGPLGTSTRSALRVYQRMRDTLDPETELFFLNRVGEPLTVTGVDTLIRHLAAESGIEGVHAHKFRHTFAVKYLAHGGDIYHLMRLLGHTNISVTQMYLRGFSQQQARQGLGGKSLNDLLNL